MAKYKKINDLIDDNLTTNDPSRLLSSKQGVILNELISEKADKTTTNGTVVITGGPNDSSTAFNVNSDGDEIFSVTRAGGVRVNVDKGKLTIYCNTYAGNSEAIADGNAQGVVYKTPSGELRIVI